MEKFRNFNFQKKSKEYKMCVFISSTILYETFLGLRIIKRDIDVNVETSRYNCRILIKLDFSDTFSKTTQISNFIKIHPVGAQFFHVDGRT